MDDVSALNALKSCINDIDQNLKYQHNATICNHDKKSVYFPFCEKETFSLLRQLLPRVSNKLGDLGVTLDKELNQVENVNQTLF